MLMDVIGVIVWCCAVYVCAYDWEDIPDRKTGNAFPGKMA